MKSIHVALKDRSYPIFVGKNLLPRTGRFLKDQSLAGHALIVSQKEVATYHAPTLVQSLAAGGFEHSIFLAPSKPSSEAAKSQGAFLKLIKNIASCDGKKRGIFLIALGGGVVGDLAGFAASVYRRGIPVVQIPTTLTAQVDSAIGGKTAIDLPEGKNLLGSIHQPALVLSDAELLSSLPDRHWTDGFAEVIKYGVIKDQGLFSLLEKKGKEGIRRDSRLLEKVIFRCAKIKAKVVVKDERDKKDIRIVLNFGHTIGHAIEAASGFLGAFTHGEAVGLGMLAACDIAVNLGLLKDRSLPERLEKMLMKFELPVFFRRLSVEAILKAMDYDKKTTAGKNRFVLPQTLAKMVIVKDVPLDVIADAIRKRKA